MTHILLVDALSRLAEYSANGRGPHSRQLANRIVTKLQATRSNAQLGHRGLSSDPIPRIPDATIAGVYTPVEDLTDELREALVLSNTLFAEIRSADATASGEYEQALLAVDAVIGDRGRAQ